MTSTLEHLAAHVENFPNLTETEINQCDLDALKYLMISSKDLEKSKEVISRLQSVYYKESSSDGGAILVCTDGSVLFAGSFVSRACHIMAFENGLRTSSELLLERKNMIDD